MPRFTKLLEPVRIGKLEIKNRMIMSPMGTSMFDEEGLPTEASMEFYFRRAAGGVGMVLIQACTILPESRATRCMPFHDDKYIPALAKIAQGVKQRGPKVSLELAHHGILLAERRKGLKVKSLDEIHVVGPSPVPTPGSTIIPRQMTREDIRHVVEGFADAAVRVKKAGFDAVQIQGGHGYLLHQFRSPVYNHRNDEYGGSVTNRARIICEVLAAVRQKVGPGFPVLLRLGGSDFSPGGVTIDDGVQQAPLFVEAGADSIDIVGGSLESRSWVFPSYDMPLMPNLPAAEAIRKVVKVPVFVAGRMGKDPVLAERAIRQGKIDGIILARTLIVDPDWPRKIASGQIADARPCLGCNECQNSIANLHYMRCAVNPVAGRELERDIIPPAKARKKVMIAGGGPGGMEAARIAATKGHQVILCEKRRQLGGLMLVGGVHNEQISAFVEWMASQIKKLPVEIRLNTEVTPALVAEIKPDAVILATGGTFRTLQVPGAGRSNVFSAHDLLKLMNGIPINKGFLMGLAALPIARPFITPSLVRRFLGTNFPVGKRVAVVGGQFPGCSLALLLAEKRKTVTVIEESARYGEGLESHILANLNDFVREGRVKILTSTMVGEINDRGAAIIDDKSNKSLLDVDTVIVALDLAPSEDKLAEDLKGKVKEVYTIGDAKSFRRIIEAVTEGYDTAFNL